MWDHDAARDARDEGRACPVTGFRGTPGIRGLGGLTGRASPLAAGELQAVRDWARVRPGQTVLVNGASSRPPWSTCSPSGGSACSASTTRCCWAPSRRGHGTHRCGCGCCCWTRTRPRPGNGPSSSGSRRSRSPAGSGSRSPASAKWLRGAPPTWRSPATTTARLAAHRHRLDPGRRHVCRGVGGPPVAVVQAHRVAGGDAAARAAPDARRPAPARQADHLDHL